MTAETHEEVINKSEIHTTSDSDSIDESWALMLLLDNETDLIKDEIITITPPKNKPRNHLSAIEYQALNFKKNKPKNINKKRNLLSFRSLLGI